MKSPNRILYVGIVLKCDNEVFLVKRYDYGWSFPGGLIEDEPVVHAAQRELREEVGVDIGQDDLTLIHVLESLGSVGFYFIAESWKGNPRNNEPQRHSEARWFDLDTLPSDIKQERVVALSLTRGLGYSRC